MAAMMSPMPAHESSHSRIRRCARPIAPSTAWPRPATGGADTARGVVLVSDRGAEHRHETVFEELVDGTLVAVEFAELGLERRSPPACPVDQRHHRVFPPPNRRASSARRRLSASNAHE